jgi:glycine/D-amino acid oxidase-like deaminating enzyme
VAGSDTAVCVLGAGISGITTALVLRLLGWDVHVVAAQVMSTSPRRPDGAAASFPPTFASLFPAASIIPHTVSIADAEWHLRTSSTFFSALSRAAGAGVRRQRHYEVFERPPSIPDYAAWLSGFRSLDHQTELPRRTGAKDVWGWSLDIFFADMPAYRRWLTTAVRALGVTMTSPHTLTKETLRALPEDIVVNCTGFGSAALFGAVDELTLVKGILLKAYGDTAAFSDRDPISYNYTPEASLYPTEAGEPGDVYCYPRADACVLGGTRLEGRLDADGYWEGESPAAPTTPINGIDVPRVMIDLNQDLLRSSFGVDISGWPLIASVGYRCRRDAAHGGVRLEKARAEQKIVVHNYGHGGAGVTYSWSSAVRVGQLIGRRRVAWRAATGTDATVIDLLRGLVTGAL